MTYTFDATAPAGSRITSVTVDGAPIDPAASYRIGTFSFLLTGGDNFRVFTEGTNPRDSGLVDRDGWIAYLQAHPGLAPDFARQSVGVPTVPSTVTAGDTLAFPVTQAGPDEPRLAAEHQPGRPARRHVHRDRARSRAAAADVSVTIPAGTSAGAHTLTLVASPSGTTVTLPLTVEAGIPSSTTTLTASPSSQVFGSSQPGAAHRDGDGRRRGARDRSSSSRVTRCSGRRRCVGGTATLRLPATTPAGTYAVVARYAGDAAVTGSESAPVTSWCTR